MVYFDADLKLERDFDFGAWDSPGVAGLISALGAGPEGHRRNQDGREQGGRRDPRVRHRTLQARGRWLGRRCLRAPIARQRRRHTRPTPRPQGAAAILEAIRKVVDAAPRGASHADRAIIEEELAAAHATIRARLARNADGYAIAAGPEHGQYLRFANALSDGKGARTISLVTRGGEENLRLLRDGKVPLALAQGDSALDAYEGKGNFAPDGPHTALRAIGSLYPEPVHVLVRADSSINSVSQFKGLRVAIGQPGSASRTTALRVLDAHGIGLKGVKPVELALNDALVALRQKEVDAVIQVIGVPADSVRDALAQIPLRLVPLSERAVGAMVCGEGRVLRVHDSGGHLCDAEAAHCHARDGGAAARRTGSLRRRGHRDHPLRVRQRPRPRGAGERSGRAGFGCDRTSGASHSAAHRRRQRARHDASGGGTVIACEAGYKIAGIAHRGA